MKWIRPGVRKLSPRKCEFCGADVETPYKGVHDETEMINGFPAKCRNNGRLNVHIYMGYLSGTKPVPNIKYFVEHQETHLWWSGYKWTNDPNEAFGCELESTADRYARFQGIRNYVITEHEFVPPNERVKI
jgi:hypothetical protein